VRVVQLPHLPLSNARLRRVVLENIRSFEHADITLERDGQITPWTVIVGDNGTGKSTVLKAIALALSTPKDAVALFETDTRGEWLRAGATSGSITIELEQLGQALTSTLSITRRPYGEALDAVTNGEVWLDSLFVCGYGASRRTLRSDMQRSYSTRNAVATLFDPEASLQDPELALRRFLSSSSGEFDPLRAIDNVLLLPPGSTKLGDHGLEVRGQWGFSAPVASLSDGYRSTLSWVLDLLGWVFLRSPEMLWNGLQGQILIDEVEQHLHPSWQRRIIGALRRQFPRVQFIVTTHASLCVTGTTDLSDDEVSLVHLGWNGDAVQAQSGLRPPRGLRADQILTSYLFGLETTTDDETKHEIERLAALLAQPTEASTAEVEQLRSKLHEKLGSEETALGREASAVVDDVLSAHLNAVIAERANMPEALSLEVRRQLQELLRPREDDQNRLP